MCSVLVSAQEARQALQHHVRTVVANGEAKPVGALPATQRLNFSIVLPLRNQAELSKLLGRLYDPSSPDYHHYLSVPEFTEQFGPTAQEYQDVIAFAEANGFQVTWSVANRMVVPMSGTVEQIEKTFGVRMNVYRHPTENRTFYSPDREPTLALHVPIAHIAGLNNFSRPQSMAVKAAGARSLSVNALDGSGPGGSYLGSDMRAAYYGGNTLTGAGQTVGLFQFDGYYKGDVDLTFASSGQEYSVPINNVLLDGCDGTPQSGDDAEEVLDIVQTIGMAPGLSQVRVYIGLIDADILAQMAAENVARQLSISWAWSPDDPAVVDQFFEEFAAQGQSVFAASGDYGAWEPNTPFYFPAEDAWVTAVGGTTLATEGAGGAWSAETAWSRSGGGASPDGIGIPAWQSGIATSSNGGSATLRNVPDVAMEGDFDNFACDMGQCDGSWAGTSFAAPRWAAFMALVNQQAALAGDAEPGFLNPTLYAMGMGSDEANGLHDITTGSNNFYAYPAQPSFNADAGYDLVTGWGSPAGQKLIDALAPWSGSTFQLALSTSGLSINPGSSGTVNVTITGHRGFHGSVNLSVAGLPNGVTAAWSANPGSTNSVLTLNVSADAPRGQYPITVSGSSGALTASTGFTLLVNGPGFMITPQPVYVQLMPGYSTATTFRVTPLGGFAGQVTYAVTSPLPNDVMASWTTDITSGVTMLTVTAGKAAPYGKVDVTIAGTSGL